ncbi:methyltransferase domain-containing protein [Gorillibacterium sp. CAU 1737]|uniref:class I SAM-dependent methyltransferase n=1 Tax=Gorillibacterium sp. CAU 1737 TaxID=3140362 RepID=UPI003261717A
MNEEKKEQLKHNQYADSGNFNARIHLHQKYGTNPYPWPFWVFDQLSPCGGAHVLELGCGNGMLWLANEKRIPEDWTLTLSDLSPGMMQDAERGLARLGDRVSFRVIDAEEIPFPDATFDKVIANHMLYHVPDREKALSEISRVLKPDGVFYASTVGSRNMRELKELMRAFDPHSGYELVTSSLTASFSLENGKEQLLNFFEDVRLVPYEDALSVTDSNALVQYALSLNSLYPDRQVLPPESAERFLDFLNEQMHQQGGRLHISKTSGMFLCRKGVEEK